MKGIALADERMREFIKKGRFECQFIFILSNFSILQKDHTPVDLFTRDQASTDKGFKTHLEKSLPPNF